LEGKYCKYLSIIYYDTTLDVKTAEERFRFISSLGLPTSLILANENVHNCTEAYDDYENEKRIKLDYDIDGVVIEVNDLSKKFELGEVYGNSKGAIAWKFGSMKAESEVVDIEWQLGNSGRITPVVIVKPILLAGVTVQKASLHNMDIFNHLNLHIGDIVLISRRNDVIPYVESVVRRTNDVNKMFGLPYPNKCPVCNGGTKIDGKFLICNEPDCSGKVSGNIKVWVKKLELKGIADATIETLCAKDMISEPSDIYSLTVNQLRDFAGFGPVQSQKIYDIINSKKELSLPEFIGGLNIPQWGSRMTELLFDAGYDNLVKIMNMNVNDLVAIKGIESKTAHAFLNGISKKKEVILNLLEAGISIKCKEQKIMSKKTGGKLVGVSFCFTGAIEKIDDEGKRYTRNRMSDLVIENGGTVEDSVKAGLNYLVQADPSSQSSKTVKAQKLGVSILSEKDFFNMIGM
jgi:DNA ligase (NAD+)